MDDTDADRWDWARGENSSALKSTVRRVARALGLHQLRVGSRRSSRAERDKAEAARQSQTSGTEGFVRTADRLGDHSAAQYCHLRRYVEALDDNRMDHTLLSLLLSAESTRDELRAYEEETSALVRLAQTGHFVRQLRRLNGVLDAASASYGVEEPQSMKEWRSALEAERADRVERYDGLLAALRRCAVDEGNHTILDANEGKSGRVILSELDSETRQEEVLVLLKYALDKYGEELTPQETRTVKEAFSLVTKYANMVAVALPTWFVPTFEFGSTFGLSRWGNDLLVLDYMDQSRFVKDVNVWSSLNHPHVAKFLGACHVGGRWFIAHEKLRPLREYVAETRTATLCGVASTRSH